MNLECRELEVLVSLRAAGGELSAPEAARLDRHLEACADCRRALDQAQDLLELVRLPPPDPAENLSISDLPSRALSELRRRERRRGLVRRTVAAAAGMALAAGVVLALLSPALFRGTPPAGAAGRPDQVVAQASWQEPDMDRLWAESAVVDDGSSASSSSTITDGVLTAYDAGDGY